MLEGNAEGDFFHGKILPGAVDTQTILSNNSGELNARYTLRGKDFQGEDCLIYIENKAILNRTQTVPRIITDSTALKWLMHTKLLGEMRMNGDILTIEVFGKTEETEKISEHLR